MGDWLHATTMPWSKGEGAQGCAVGVVSRRLELGFVPIADFNGRKAEKSWDYCLLLCPMLFCCSGNADHC